jgi:peptidoglycan hydrolase FlgJ
MSLDLNAQSAMTALQNGGIAKAKSLASSPAAQKTAQDFEGVFISQMLSQMFGTVETDDDGYFGGGIGEDMFRSLMINEYGKQVAAQGGIGLSQSVLGEMVKMQEHRP